jgi:hypothetical protein
MEGEEAGRRWAWTTKEVVGEGEAKVGNGGESRLQEQEKMPAIFSVVVKVKT